MTNILSGAVDVTNASNAFANWTGAPLYAGNCPDDSQIAIDGVLYHIASLTDTTSGTLSRNYAGSTATGVTAEIDPYTAAQVSTVTLNTTVANWLRLLQDISGTGVQPNGIGDYAGRSTYDAQVQGYVYLSMDGDGGSISTPVLFVKDSATSGDWSDAITIEGPQGPAGVIGDWKGAWVTATAYAVNDAVSEAGSAYICLVAHTSGTFATDLAASKWGIVASKGDTGATGATGAAGANGANGVLSSGSAGTTDNALLRADGTGGNAVQGSALIVDDSGNTSGMGTLAVGAVTTSGLLTTTNGQISFPATQNPSSGANVLDDYEEGTTTPSYTFGGTSTGITYSQQNGVYVKIGQSVSVNNRLVLSSVGTATGTANIAGLPFTSTAYTVPVLFGYYYAMTMPSANWPAGYVNASATTILMLYAASTSGIATLSNTAFTNTSNIMFGVNYRAAA